MIEKTKAQHKRGLLGAFIPSVISDKQYSYIAETNTMPLGLKIEFTDSRQIISWGLVLIGILFAGGLLWMALAEITGTVIAPGSVKIVSERQAIQHLEGGIVKEIMVKNGDKVTAGQPLIVLESSSVNASVVILRTQQHRLRLTAVRLQAERSRTEHIVWPDDLLEPVGNDFEADVSTLLNSEQKIFDTRRKALADNVELLEKQTEQIKEVINSLKQRIYFKELVVASLTEELVAKNALYEDRYIDKSLVLNLQRALSQAEAGKGQLVGNIKERLGKIAELAVRVESVYDDYTRRAITDLNTVTQQLIDVKERLFPMLDAQQRLVVLASVAGEVMSLQVHSTGEVLSPGITILEIVPDNAPLIIETKIPTTDIAKIHRGLTAEVQLAAFNSRTNPKIGGEVTYISADREEIRTAYGSQSFYIVHIMLNRDDLQSSGLYISPGMPVAAFINTEPRTVLSSFLGPLRHSIDRALRED